MPLIKILSLIIFKRKNQNIKLNKKIKIKKKKNKIRQILEKCKIHKQSKNKPNSKSSNKSNKLQK